MLRTSAKLAGLTAAAASAATGTMLARDDDLRKRAVRTYTFWSRSLPIYAQYRYMDWKTKTWTQEERDAAFMPLHERNVDKVVGKRIYVMALPWRFVGGEACICRLVGLVGG